MAPFAKAAIAAGTRPPKATMELSSAPLAWRTWSITARTAGSGPLAASITPSVSSTLFFAPSTASGGRSSKRADAAQLAKCSHRSASSSGIERDQGEHRAQDFLLRDPHRGEEQHDPEA